MTPEQYDDVYHSAENWAQARDITDPQTKKVTARRLDEGDRVALERHRELIGPVIRDGRYPDNSPFQAQIVAQQIHAHWSSIRVAAHDRFQGVGMENFIKGCYQAAVFGRHVYCEGSPGTGKTAGMTWLSKVMKFTLAELSCSADATDLSLVGGEIPVKGLEFVYQNGPVTRVGAIGCLFDELPRLPTQTSNSILDVLAERKKRLSLVASGKADHVMLLSPHWFMMGTGNPVAVGGQSAERSQALWERIQIGLLMPQPQSEERLEMYKAHQKGVVDPMAPQRANQIDPTQAIPPTFTFREARAALYEVNVPPALCKLIIAACFAITPGQFKKHYGWDECTFEHKDFFAEYRKKAGRRELAALSALEGMVADYLDPMEGSNPRCELALIDNARAIRLLDSPQNELPVQRFIVREHHVAEAFRQAHRARMKALPGDEDKVEAILDKAVEAFFPE